MSSCIKNVRSLSVRSKSAGIGILIILIVVLLFTSCQTDTDDSKSLNGSWSDEYGNIIINTAAGTIIYAGSYEGKIANSPSPDYSAVSGVLIIEFTKYWDVEWVPDPDDSENWIAVSEENTENIGKFGALYWTDLTLNSVRMSDAGTGGMYDYEHTMFNTITEAQAAFTPYQDKVITYVDWSALTPYTK